MPSTDSTLNLSNQAAATGTTDAPPRLQLKARHQTELLACAAHELRAPLGAIVGYVELLLSERVGPLNDSQKQILRDLTLSCARLERFTQDFLACSALEAGGLAMRFQVGDLVGCLSEVCDLWRPRFEEEGIALCAPVATNIRRFAFDYDKVAHAVSNLLDNARKFSPPGGSVRVSVEPYTWERRVTPNGNFPGDQRSQTSTITNSVRVTVSDTGPGISPEYHQEIFDAFVKIAQPGGTKDGSGLGLAIVRRLVRAHGGKVWVESKTGSGSTFSVLLPLKPLANSAVQE